jgi:hypothetical protein
MIGLQNSVNRDLLALRAEPVSLRKVVLLHFQAEQVVNSGTVVTANQVASLAA